MKSLYVRCLVAAGLSAGMFSAAACGEEEVLRPAPVEAVVSSGSSSSSSSSSGGAFSGREVIVRDPMGAVQKTKNLLWDGDFEWRPSFQDQYGWLYGATTQQLSFALPPLKMGAACRSGVKCAELPSGGALLGLAVSFEGKSLSVSVWAAPESGKCNDMGVFLIERAGFGDQATILATDERPNAEGWCQYSALLAERTSALYLYVQATGTAALVDDASIEPVDGEAQQATALNAGQPNAGQPDAGLGPPPSAAKVAMIRAWGRAAEQPRVAPPNEGQKKFQQHMSKRWGVRGGGKP